MKKSAIFVYISPIFDSELLVCIGSKIADIKKWAGKNSKNLTGILKIEDNYKHISQVIDGKNSGAVFRFEKNGVNFYILWLEKYTGKWHDIYVLIHEITHYKQNLFITKAVIDETEFEAYFMEATLRDLIRLIGKNLHIK